MASYDPSGLQEQLRKLEESRPQPRNPHACDQCAKAHRKCVFSKRADICDNCIKGCKACSSVPRATGSSQEDYDRSSPRTQRQTPQHASSASGGGPVRGSGDYSPVSPTYPQTASGYPQSYGQAAAHGTQGVGGAFAAPQNAYNSAAYGPSDGGDYRQATGSRAATAQVRGQSDYYSAAGGHSQPLSPTYDAGAAQWGGYDARAQQQQQQPQQPQATGQAYATQAAMYPGAVQSQIQRQVSTPMSQARSTTYQAQTPIAEQGREYYIPGANMYQVPQDGRQQTVAHGYSSTTGYTAQGQMAPDSATDGGAYTRQHRG